MVTSGSIISNRLTRAVSKVDIQLNRGDYSGGSYQPLPFESGTNMMNNIREIRLDIEGVGTRMSYNGSSGVSSTYFATSQSSIDDNGFALFEGPFVFPSPSDVSEAAVKIMLMPVDSSLPGIETVVAGKLERNKKLIVTLWLSVDNRLLDVTYDMREMTAETEGDFGIWE